MLNLGGLFSRLFLTLCFLFLYRGYQLIIFSKESHIKVPCPQRKPTWGKSQLSCKAKLRPAKGMINTLGNPGNRRHTPCPSTWLTLMKFSEGGMIWHLTFRCQIHTLCLSLSRTRTMTSPIYFFKHILDRTIFNLCDCEQGRSLCPGTSRQPQSRWLSSTSLELQGLRLGTRSTV